MPISYGTKFSKLTPGEITPESFQAIGRLVRAFAELEDIILLHICSLSGISESNAVVFLGRLPISKKVEIAHYLSKMKGEEALTIQRRYFGPEFSETLKIRNAVAHGTFLGTSEDGELCFLTSDITDPNNDAAVQVAIAMLPESLAKHAERAEKAVGFIEKGLTLSALREKRLAQSLSPHRKGLTQQQRGQKPRNRPQSSGA